MAKRMLTVGMAGHIDHGKTTLTKALTNIDTDRLKEEKDRSISIEPGFAPLTLREDMDVSIIDVPGHERFIRQMIAGVAGIDGVILTVAADEGVMPQTKEHLEILTLLGIPGSVIAVTKADKVDEELLELAGEDIRDEVQGTPFANAEMVFIDSLSGRGLDELKQQLIHMLEKVPDRDPRGAFRLPIDNVFSVHGQGTVVRGTVYEGSVAEGESLQLLPQQTYVKVRQLQIHHEPVKSGSAGQRLALNISGVSKQDVHRGDVLVAAQHYTTTDRLDVVLYGATAAAYAVKQRGYVMLHLGTAEVYGKIIFFDRNTLEPGFDEVICQLELEEKVVTKRGDAFILRRPSPAETFAGGWVIQAQAEKHRFGTDTVKALERMMEDTPEEQLLEAIRKNAWLSKEEGALETGRPEEEVEQLIHQGLENGTLVWMGKKKVTSVQEQQKTLAVIKEQLQQFHEAHSLRSGQNRQELIQSHVQRGIPKEFAAQLIQQALNQGELVSHQQFIALAEFSPTAPKGWERRIENLQEQWQKDGLQVKAWNEYMEAAGLPENVGWELKWSLLERNRAVKMDDTHIWPAEVFKDKALSLKKAFPESFTLQQAKEILPLSRKFMVPYLEALDASGWTKRKDDVREWLEQ
ncbi:selenocysteine-specific translation elongation factor [Sinobaca sp. H24]|uniref:selenocysteine-specific translation elongation factor n=1 Tax=Sinobaca sp. H24 TaxID=2923376 RepID=UPI00207AA511|nr:selenocysteine-specific translation elongation factor [Sinobaca sp. H24]